MSEPRKLITVSDMEAMSPQERADVIDSAIARSWDEVPESFRAEVLSTAHRLSEQRSQRG